MKATDKAETNKPAENKNTVKIKNAGEEKINQELPAELIPGQKEFNEKRKKDIENIKNEYVRTRHDGKKTSGESSLKASIKLVKKIFRKKKK
jgi:hypothetical protein